MRPDREPDFHIITDPIMNLPIAKVGYWVKERMTAIFDIDDDEIYRVSECDLELVEQNCRLLIHKPENKMFVDAIDNYRADIELLGDI